MSKGLEALYNLYDTMPFAFEESRTKMRYLETIEKELKDYQEIKEIAKRYNWDDITSKIFNVKTDKKYRELFSSAIVNIQEDYRKARALEIIKDKANIVLLDELNDDEPYWIDIGCSRKLTKEEYDLLKEVML